MSEIGGANLESIKAATISLVDWARSRIHLRAEDAELKPYAQPSHEHFDLLNWVTRELKGKQRRVLEMVIEAGGRCSLSVIAMDVQVSWATPYDDNFNGLRKAVNPKLKSGGLPWKLERHDSEARLARIGQK